MILGALELVVMIGGAAFLLCLVVPLIVLIITGDWNLKVTLSDN